MKNLYHYIGIRSTYVQSLQCVSGEKSNSELKILYIKDLKSLILHFHILDFSSPKVTNPSPHMRDKVFAFEIEIQRKKQKTDSM